MNIEYLKKLYLEQDKTLSEISKITGLTTSKIRRIFRINGIRKTPFKLGNKIYDNKGWLYNEYVINKKAYSKIAAEQGVNYMTILERIIHFGFDVRGHKDIDKGKPNRGKKRINETVKKIKDTRVKNRQKVICTNCSITFEKTISSINNNKTGNFFCNSICYKEYRRKNRKPKEYYNNIRFTSEYKEWRSLVYKRDNYKCQMPDCNDRSSREIDAHHIYPIRDFPDKVFEVDNGITLCKSCHKKVNKKEYNYIDMLVRIIQK